MQPHGLLTVYATKPIEYAVAIIYLALFAGFWRYVNGNGRTAGARAWTEQIAQWFSVPEHLYFHPGHAWARAESSGVMAIGIDDFAQHLVGTIAHVVLPQVGQELTAGDRALALRADGKAVDVLAPVSGVVVAVNDTAASQGAIVNEDPYGRGWLLKVRVPDAAGAVRPLLSGAAARRWIDETTERLMQTMTPQLGKVYADGGQPVHGIARAIDEERWDDIARRFLLS